MNTTVLPRMLCTWFTVGALVLLLTPLPPWVASLGWAPLLWLLVTPLVMLLAVDPRWPLRQLATWLRNRQRRGAVCNSRRAGHRLYSP